MVRGGVEHGASAVEDSPVIDVFTPCREDYIAYLHWFWLLPQLENVRSYA